MTAKQTEILAGLEGFLRAHVPSYDHLETLLLLRRRGDDTWTVAAVAAELHCAPSAAAESLAELAEHGLLTTAGAAYRYAPVEPADAAMVDKLLHAYDVDRLAVVHLMNANAFERVRNHALSAFTEAFVLGRKKDRDG